MAYQGKFPVNNAPLPPLTILGVDTFNAYSGNDQYLNRGDCTMVPSTGPIPVHHSEWFALYRDDGLIDDFTWINGVQRGQFRLHPAGGRGISLGCITLPSRTDFLRIRSALLHTKKIPTTNSGLNAYGTIEVITYGNTCP